jgi:hypothetical protein
VFVTASIDGGRSFLPPVRVSTAPACTDETIVQSPTGGDYFGLASTPDGSFRLLWSEMRDGLSLLALATIRVDR